MDVSPKRLTTYGKEIPSFLASFFTLLVFGLLPFTVSAQETSPAMEEILKGKKVWTEGYYDSAYQYFRAGQKIALRENDDQGLVAALHRSGMYLTRQGLLEEGAMALDSAVAMAERVGAGHPEIILARCEKAYLGALAGELEEYITRMEQISEESQTLPSLPDSVKAMVFHRMGIAYTVNSRYEDALGACKKGLDIRENIYPEGNVVTGHSYNSMGVILTWLDQYEEAIVYYEKADSLLGKLLRPGHTQVVQIRTNIAILYEDLGLFWEALNTHRESLPYLSELSPPARFGVLFNYATTLNVLGDYQEALAVLTKAENLLNEYPGIEPGGMALIYSEKSGIYQGIGNDELALKYVDLAIEETRILRGEDHPELINVYTRKGNLLMETGNFDLSLASFTRATRMADRHPDYSGINRGWAWEYMGEAQVMAGLPRIALTSFQKASHIYRESQLEWQNIDLYRKTATAWRALGSFDSAMMYHRKAWDALMPNLPFEISPDKNIAQYWTKTQLALMMEEQGNTLFQEYSQHGSSEYLLPALHCYQAAITLVDSQRYYYQSNGSKEFSIQAMLPVYEQALNILYLLNEQKPENQLLAEAFSLTEQSKANSLRDHLWKVDAMKLAVIPESMIRKEQYFRQRMASLSEEFFDEETPREMIPQLTEDLHELQQDYRQFLITLEQQYPRYFELKYSRSSPSPDEIRRNLDDGQAMYSYFWGEKNLFVFHLSAGQTSFHKITLTDKLTDNIRQWAHFISHPPSEDHGDNLSSGKTGMEILDILLPGKDESKEEFLIIPDGLLGYIPFESFPVSVTSSDKYSEWSFLGSKKRFNYFYSSELWLRKISASVPKNYTGFAPTFSGEYSGTRAETSPLAFNQAEINSCAELLGGMALTGDLASENALYSNLGNPQILHFATHAIADENDLMNSRIFFTPVSSSEADNILHAYEIYGLALNSPLTVLSACQTGRGPFQRGEGVMSLARAFQFAGSERVISTLWKSDDKSSADIMVGFFHALSGGQDINHALQSARNQWLSESPSYLCHPYYWAGFITIGNGKGARLANRNKFLWILLLGLVIGGIGGGVIMSRKKTRR